LPPVIGVADLDPASSYNTLFLAVSRLGFTPRLCRDVAEAVGSDVDVVVLLNPVDAQLVQEVSRLKSFLSRGGSLVVFCESNQGFSGTQILAELGIEVPTSTAGENGTEPSVSRHSIESGSVTVVRGSRRLSDGEMGNPMDEPTAAQQQRYQVAYEILRRAVSRESEAP
jgi:hypothetical protein